jgi:hypothetical protein
MFLHFNSKIIARWQALSCLSCGFNMLNFKMILAPKKEPHLGFCRESSEVNVEDKGKVKAKVRLRVRARGRAKLMERAKLRAKVRARTRTNLRVRARV